MNGKVKIIDIARQSGVSMATVSLVLNNKPGVSQETRSRIFRVAQELGYLVKSPDIPEKVDPLTTIGMVVKIDPDMSPQANPFYSNIMAGVDDICKHHGINLVFSTLPVDEDNYPLEVPHLLNDSSLNGLLVVGIHINELITGAIARLTTPTILVDSYSDNNCFDSVISNNYQAAYQAVDYLIQKGHRHIGMLGGDSRCFPSLEERRSGYFDALKDNHISEIYPCNFNINCTHGYQSTLSLLKAHPQITALFCVNDDVGSAAILAVQTLGLRVPEDVSIIGYDDTFVATSTHPPLTTMYVDTLAMGRTAVRLLTFRLENPASARMTLMVHPMLIERDSVCPAPEH
jgi:LacI family transcriptional regulator